MQYSDKLDNLEKRYEELSAQMADPAIISDNELYRKTAKAQRDMEEVVVKYREYKATAENLKQAQGMRLRQVQEAFEHEQLAGAQSST